VVFRGLDEVRHPGRHHHLKLFPGSAFLGDNRIRGRENMRKGIIRRMPKNPQGICEAISHPGNRIHGLVHTDEIARHRLLTLDEVNEPRLRIVRVLLEDCPDPLPEGGIEIRL